MKFTDEQLRVATQSELDRKNAIEAELALTQPLIDELKLLRKRWRDRASQRKHRKAKRKNEKE